MGSDGDAAAGASMTDTRKALAELVAAYDAWNPISTGSCDAFDIAFQAARRALAETPAREEARSECAHCERIDAAMTEVMEERDRACDALLECSMILGGPEWCGKLPPEPPPNSGDLHLDVPELCRQLVAARPSAEEAQPVAQNDPTDPRTKLSDALHAIADRVQTVGRDYSVVQRSLDGNALHEIAQIVARSTVEATPPARDTQPVAFVIMRAGVPIGLSWKRFDVEGDGEQYVPLYTRAAMASSVTEPEK